MPLIARYNKFMQLNQNTDFALRTLIYLGTADKLVRIRDISDAYDISFNHLTKTVQQLVLAGYVKSKQGKNGGIQLALPPKQINLRRVVEDIEKNLALVECMGPNNLCVISSKCLLKGIIINATEAFLKELQTYTLEDILDTKKSLSRILKINT